MSGAQLGLTQESITAIVCLEKGRMHLYLQQYNKAIPLLQQAAAFGSEDAQEALCGIKLAACEQPAGNHEVQSGNSPLLLRISPQSLDLVRFARACAAGLATAGNDASAFSLYNKVGICGGGDVLCALGRCYRLGWGVQKDISAAVSKFTDACLCGSFRGLELLRMCRQDPSAQSALQNAYRIFCGESGKTSAQIPVSANIPAFMAYCMLHGIGTPENVAGGYQLLLQAPDDGIRTYLLAECANKGWGREQSVEEAQQLYVKASQEGNAWAAVQLWHFTEDAQWLQLAATQFHPTALYLLGQSQEQLQNISAAQRLYAIAAHRGSPQGMRAALKLNLAKSAFGALCKGVEMLGLEESSEIENILKENKDIPSDMAANLARMGSRWEAALYLQEIENTVMIADSEGQNVISAVIHRYAGADILGTDFSAYELAIEPYAADVYQQHSSTYGRDRAQGANGIGAVACSAERQKRFPPAIQNGSAGITPESGEGNVLSEALPSHLGEQQYMQVHPVRPLLPENLDKSSLQERLFKTITQKPDALQLPKYSEDQRLPPAASGGLPPPQRQSPPQQQFHPSPQQNQFPSPPQRQFPPPPQKDFPPQSQQQQQQWQQHQQTYQAPHLPGQQSYEQGLSMSINDFPTSQPPIRDFQVIQEGDCDNIVVPPDFVPQDVAPLITGDLRKWQQPQQPVQPPPMGHYNATMTTAGDRGMQNSPFNFPASSKAATFNCQPRPPQPPNRGSLQWNAPQHFPGPETNYSEQRRGEQAMQPELIIAPKARREEPSAPWQADQQWETKRPDLPESEEISASDQLNQHNGDMSDEQYLPLDRILGNQDPEVVRDSNWSVGQAVEQPNPGRKSARDLKKQKKWGDVANTPAKQPQPVWQTDETPFQQPQAKFVSSQQLDQNNNAVTQSNYPGFGATIEESWSSVSEGSQLSILPICEHEEVERARRVVVGQEALVNDESAFKLYRRVACATVADDVDDVMLALAQCYDSGIGTAQDTGKAIKCYMRLAENGDRSAVARLRALSQLPATDRNTVKRIVGCFKEAASTGSPSAQVALGYCYLWGMGVRRNREEAGALYRAAAQQCDDAALEFAKTLGQGMLEPVDSDEVLAIFNRVQRMAGPHTIRALADCYERCAGQDANRAELQRMRQAADAAQRRPQFRG